jgi:hypothetical protein
VVIPSRNIHNLTACLGSLAICEPDLPVIIVDDGLEWTKSSGLWASEYHRRSIFGIRPFIFARNSNLGIAAAGRDDVILLNDDAQLHIKHGFHLIKEQWLENPGYGLIASSIDHCGTPEQVRRGASGLRELPVMAMFACVFIPLVTTQRIGLLDERFGVNAGGPGARGYGVEDYEYCWRIRKAGLKIGVSDSCYVIHTKLPSTFRHRDRRAGEPRMADVGLHEKLFQEIYGQDAYT